jgi:ribosomal protein L11 methyltransferase
LDVVIDPGRAFGTGAHVTTRLCIGMLVEIAGAGVSGPFIDLGSGSGVLAIAAAKLGWSPVWAYDHERAAIEAASQNAALNEVRLRLRMLNLRDQLPSLAPTAVANLTAPLLRQIAARLRGQELPLRLVCSGLLAAEVDEVSDAFACAGLPQRDRRVEDGWAALLLER